MRRAQLRKRSWAVCSNAWFPRPAAKRRKPRPWVRLGLPEARVFQAALPITPANHQHTPQNFFLEAVQATNVRAEDRIVELIKVELGGRAAGVRGRFAAQCDRIVDRDDLAGSVAASD